MATRAQQAGALSAVLIIPGFLILTLGLIMAIATVGGKHDRHAPLLIFSTGYVLTLGTVVTACGVGFAAWRKTSLAVVGLLIFTLAAIIPLCLGLDRHPFPLGSMVMVLWSVVLFYRLLRYLFANEDEAPPA
jgi:hypothetical protein